MFKSLIVLVICGYVTLFGQLESQKKSFIESMPGISVTIGGSFIINGSFPAYLNERVDQYISRIHLQAIQNMNTELPPAISTSKIGGTQMERMMNPNEYSLRGIKLKRINGEIKEIDLAKFRITGDFQYNPYLQNDDILIFPVLDLEKKFVSIDGAVNKPGKYEYIVGDKLNDFLMLALGINNSYENVQKVRINRLSYDGDKEEILEYQISENPEIKLGDRISIVAEESQKRDYRINIIGEVTSPGYISISKNKTSLREVIKRAGGFRSDADLNRAELIRGANVFRNILFTEEFENMMMTRMAKIIDEDSLSFILDNKLRYARGNGLIDFNRVLEDGSPEGDFIVKDGDVISIPEKLNLVYVFGQVKKPGYVEFTKDNDYRYYLNKAGGLGDLAREEVYVIKGQSRTWLEIKEDETIIIEPGDYIWIPKEIPRNFTYYLSRIAAVSSVIGTVATIIILVIQTTK